jgi:hypothetical protein
VDDGSKEDEDEDGGGPEYDSIATNIDGRVLPARAAGARRAGRLAETPDHNSDVGSGSINCGGQDDEKSVFSVVDDDADDDYKDDG